MAIIKEENGDASADFETQYTISLGDVFQGSLEPGNDRDYVRVELTAGKYYEVRVPGVTSPDIDIDSPRILANGLYLPPDARFIFRFDVSDTYYIIVKSDDIDFSGDYELSITEYTPSVATYDEIAGALYASRSQPPRAFDVGPGGVLTADITDLSEDWQQLARLGLEAWTNVTGIIFELVDDEDAHITFDNKDSIATGGPTKVKESIILTSRINLPDWHVGDPSGADIIKNSYFLYVVIHEIGHALGLDHPGPYPLYATYGIDNLFLNDSYQATAMSYFSQTENTDVDAGYAFPITPMIADIIAIQYLYGVPTDIRAGDTVYGYQSNVDGYLGEFFARWTSETTYPSGREVALTLYDNGGNDTLDLRTDIHDQRVDLRPEGISDVYGLVGNLVIARDTLIENFVAGSGNDRVIGNAAANRLDGGAGNDDLRGNGGNDTLTGGPGADRLDGGPGADRVSYQDSDAGVTVNLRDGTGEGGHAQGDIITGVAHITGSAYPDVLVGDNGANQLDGGAGDDDLRGNGGNDTLTGGPGADRLDGGPGADRVSYQRSDAGVTVNLRDGTGEGGHAQGDIITDVEHITGSAYPDVLVGDNGANQLDGGAGDDELRGSGGNDVLAGGAGADRLYGGEGTDWVSYQGSDAPVSVRLYDGLAEGGHAEGDTLSGFENARGSAYADLLAGNSRANRLEGGAGDDRLYGGGGEDVLEGGAGADRLDGGAGADRVSYQSSDAGVTVNLRGGTGEGGHAEGDVLVDVENVTGSAYRDVLTGDAGSNRLDGGSGNDLLEGAGGGDVLDGGGGVDWVSYQGSDAGVSVRLYDGLAEGGHAQGDTLNGFENARGSAYADLLAGNSRANRLAGGAGDDRLYGGGGEDVLDGGAGNDRMWGGSEQDVLAGGAGADRLNGGDGVDRVSYQGSDAGVMVNLDDGTVAGGHAEGDVIAGFEGIIGSAYPDVLHGDNGANQLDGGGGDDVLTGGAGADWLDGGAGFDEVSYQGSGAGVTVNLDDGTGAGGHAQGDMIAEVEGVTGSAYPDVLIGDNGANQLDGGGGDDVLTGGAGADRLDGGAGFDEVSYQGSGAGVTVNLGNGTGEGGHAEGDTLADIEDIVGSVHDDTLTGAGGANRLEGGRGNDVLEGGAGADRLDGGAGTDWLSYQGSDGPVSVRLYDGYARGGHAEGDTLSGFENLRGSAYADTLAGNGRGNRLDGGAGNDQLRGGNGDDVLDGGSGDDQLRGGSGDDVLDGGGGSDRFYGGPGADWITYRGSDAGVTVDLEAGTSGGGDAEGDVIVDVENIIGSKYDDALTGDNGANRLTGGGGDDGLWGGGGDDILDGGGGADRLNGGSGTDTIEYRDSNEAVRVNLKRGTGAGGHAEGDEIAEVENIVGSAHDDMLTGADGSNRLDGGRGEDELIGGAGADRLEGGAGEDRLHGDDGDDHLDGGDGHDILEGGAGADRLNGGAGGDIALYVYSDAGVTVNLGEGTSEGGHAQGDVIADVEHISGSAYPDKLVGDNGYNQLRGRGGDDVLTGGAGNDYLIGDEGKDIFIFAAGHGDDTIQDFTNDQDLIDLTAFGLSGFDELIVSSPGEYNIPMATIDLSAHGGGTILLRSFDIANLDASDFIF